MTTRSSFSFLFALLLPFASMACASSADGGDSSTSSAAVTNNNNEGEAGYDQYLLADLFMRQVLSGKMLQNADTDAQNYQILQVALEGPGDGKITASAGRVTCDRGLGSDYCDVSIGTDVVNPPKNGNETEAGYTLHVRVHQGTVISASMELTAG